ncbi:putative protein FAM10A4 [Prorops nasuta]|uniref:putative protein FAM10A4 n=1 Tax=Prorops nasuta TaxID=863751 RepID=UPI0034CF56E6
MADSMSQENLNLLKSVLTLITSNPGLLQLPNLAFIKSFIEHFGGKVPEDASEVPPNVKNQFDSKPKESEPEPEPEPEEESEESDVELDMTGVITPDNDSPQEMGDPNFNPNDDQIAEAHNKRSEAVSAFMEKDYEKALKLYTEAIKLNPQTPLMYTKRGQIYLLVGKPNACIRDCERALELNPDSAAAHKFRGRAFQLLGKWEEAATDLRLACRFDFDEQADEWLREITPNVKKIEEHKRKKERKMQEKLEKERQERLKNARKAQEAARQSNNTQSSNTDSSGAPPNMGNFFQFLNDPEVMQAFQDPEVAEAFKDISSNPSKILKYQNNPKIMALINKVASQFGGSGMPGGFPGMPGGMPGGFPFAGANPSPNPPKPGPTDDDVGLD